MNEIIVKDFSAEWCQPCKLQHNVIKELKKKFDSRVKFEIIDIDKNEKIADKFKIMSVPTLIILKNNKVVSRIVGLTSIKELETKLNKLLKKAEHS